MVFYFGIVGYFLGAFLGLFFCLLIFWKKLGHKLKFSLQPRTLFLFIRSGLVLFFLNLSYLIFFSIDRLFVFSYYGKLELGYYAIGLVFANLMFFLLYTFVLPLVPKIFQNIKNNSKMQKLIIIPTKLTYLIAYWIVFMILFLFPFISFIMPEYASGFIYINILVFAVMFFPILIINYYIGKNKEKFLLILTIFFILLAVISDILVSVFQLSPIYIAIATLVTFFLYGTTLNMIGYREILGTWRLAINKVFNYLWPLGYALIGYALLWLLANYWFYDFISYYSVKIIQAVLFTIWYSPILWKVERDHKIFKIIWKSIKNKI